MKQFSRVVGPGHCACFSVLLAAAGAMPSCASALGDDQAQQTNGLRVEDDDGSGWESSPVSESMDASVGHGDDTGVGRSGDAGERHEDGGDAASLAIKIKDIRSLWEGRCTTRSTVAEDGSTAAVTIEGLVAEAENEVALDQCVLEVLVEGTPGLEYAVDQLIVRGNAFLAPGATGRITVASEFNWGSRWGGAKAALLRAAHDGPFDLQLDLGEKAWVFSSCKEEENMTIRVMLALDAHTRGLSKLELTDLTLSRFAVRPCTP